MIVTQARLEVVKGEVAEGFDGAVGMLEGEVGVGDAVEEGGFDEGVVGHVVEGEGVSYFQGAREGVVTEGVAGEAGEATESMRDWGLGWRMCFSLVVLRSCCSPLLSESDVGPVGHFEDVGSVAGGGDVEDGVAKVIGREDIEDGGFEDAGVDGERLAGFEPDLHPVF